MATGTGNEDLVVPPAPRARYIRTFAGDMRTLKEGGTPDLTPMPDQSESSPAASIKPLRAAPPALPSDEEPLAPPAQSTPPALQPLPLPRPDPEPAPIHTYSSDFSDRIKETSASRAAVLAAEQDAPQRPQAAAGRRAANWAYLVGALALFALGAGSAYAGYRAYTKRSAPVALAPRAPTPIFADEQEDVAGVGAPLAQAIEQSAMRAIVSGSVRALPHAGGGSVFLALQEPTPEILLRNINAGGGMVGILRADAEQHPFFILPVASYGDTFAGMLAWERTMPGDLAAIFPPAAPDAATTSATSTPAQGVWRDEVVDNHDARVYRDAQGRALIAYGYANQRLLLIARDPAAFTELITRLATPGS